MADGTHIEWTDATVNAINGCSVLSPGCKHCYAMRLAGTRLRNHPSRAGLTQQTKAGPVWTGEVRLNEAALLQPLRWKRPRRIFWNAHGDTFHDAVPDEWIDRMFAVMALTPQHQHQVLTKRSTRMRAYFAKGSDAARLAIYELANERKIDSICKNEVLFTRAINALAHFPLRNVWLGVSVEDQARADERIPDLLVTPAAVRFLSCEPLLGPIVLRREENQAERICRSRIEASTGVRQPPPADLITGIDWIIVGGESGPGTQPMHPDWARSLRDQCAAARVPFFFKQWGDWEPATPDRGHFDSSMASNGAKWVHECDGLVNGPSWHRSDGKTSEEASPFAMIRVGKKAAGRLLDGVEHNEMPS